MTALETTNATWTWRLCLPASTHCRRFSFPKSGTGGRSHRDPELARIDHTKQIRNAASVGIAMVPIAAVTMSRDVTGCHRMSQNVTCHTPSRATSLKNRNEKSRHFGGTFPNTSCFMAAFSKELLLSSLNALA